MIEKLLKELLAGQVDEVYFCLGSPIKSKNQGTWKNHSEDPMMMNQWTDLVEKVLNSEQKNELEKNGVVRGLYRGTTLSSVRFQIFQSKQSLAAVLRAMPPQAEETNLPDVLFATAKRPASLTLLCGTANSGLTLLMHQILSHFDKNLVCPVTIFSSQAFPTFPEKKVSINYFQTQILKEQHREIAMASDIIFLDYNDFSQLSLALELADAGKAVVLSTYANSVENAVLNLQAFCSEHGKFESFRLMAHLQHVFHHQFLKTATGPISIYESLLFSSEIRDAFLRGDFALCAKAEKVSGLYMSRNQCLLQNLIRRKIDIKKAFEMSQDPDNLDSLLKKVGI